MIFGPKIGKKFENQVQKLSNFKEKKGLFGKENKLGLSLRTKKGLFWAKILINIELKGQKLTNSQKKKEKKDILGQKNKLGLSLRRKKRIFGPKIGKKFENKVQKLSNSKEKKGLFWPKKQAQILPLSRKMIDSTKNKLGLSLRTKKGLFWAKILINLECKGQKLTKSQKKKKRTFRAKITCRGST